MLKTTLACVGAWPFLFHISTRMSTAGVVAVEETVCFLFLYFSFFREHASLYSLSFFFLLVVWETCL
jgi:hypothetical protein